VLGGLEGGGAGLSSSGGATSNAQGGQTQGGQAQGGRSQAQGGQGGSGGWTDSTCYQALAEGHTGDACRGQFSCNNENSVLMDCCHLLVTCSNGNLAVSKVCEGCCKNDNDCLSVPGQWCINGRCQDCPPAEKCPTGWTSLPRSNNLCQWCVPPQGCGPALLCPPDQTCYLGRACSPICLTSDDPSCCWGNQCSAPGCDKTADLDCSIVGCPDGQKCNMLYGKHKCSCVDGTWLCSTNIQRNSCVPVQQ